MKLALMQLDADDPAWSLASLPTLLKLAQGADLVVFPEFMPFKHTGKQVPTLATVGGLLCQCSPATPHSPAFMAGGYVREGRHLRNAVLLVHQGQVKGHYFKRIRWQSERFIAGTSGVKFSWGPGLSCIPLICADAADNPSAVGTRMMHEALSLGANADTPIVVVSYGAELAKAEWREPLYLWSAGCAAPVAICGISGKSKATYLEDGIQKHYGGGGSAVFWPDGSRTRQSQQRGVYLIDTLTGDLTFRRIPDAVSKSR